MCVCFACLVGEGWELKFLKIWSEIMNGRDHLEDMGMDGGRLVCKWR